MGAPRVAWFGKALQALGLLVVLVGLAVSIGLGQMDEGLSSMMVELQALLLGALLFAAGTLVLRLGGGGGSRPP